MISAGSALADTTSHITPGGQQRLQALVTGQDAPAARTHRLRRPAMAMYMGRVAVHPLLTRFRENEVLGEAKGRHVGQFVQLGSQFARVQHATRAESLLSQLQ